MNNNKLGLRQIKIPNQLYSLIKQDCRHCKKTMMQFYAEMLDWFIQHCADDLTIVYHASYKHGRTLSLWLDQDQLTVIRRVALRVRVSDARVIYTAMILYSRKVKEYTAASE
jgi:hypothetical protein